MTDRAYTDAEIAALVKQLEESVTPSFDNLGAAAALASAQRRLNEALEWQRHDVEPYKVALRQAEDRATRACALLRVVQREIERNAGRISEETATAIDAICQVDPPPR